jgi:hypothetical protein
MNEVIVVDSNGTRMNPPKNPPRKTRRRANPFMPLKKGPTEEQLERLEDAIYELEPFRTTFLNLIAATIPRRGNLRERPTIEGSLKNLPSGSNVACRFCWEVLVWRPKKDKDGRLRVIVGNPYLK